MKRQGTEMYLWDKIFAKYVCYTNFVSRIYKELSKLNKKKTNNQLKWVKYMNLYFTKNL